jgi:methionyl-tRNA synthetase
MSKSRGNVKRADPIRRVVGIDGMRYFLFRDIVFGQDGSFSYDALLGRYNSDLANGLGNLTSRTLTMIGKYCAGALPGVFDAAIGELAAQVIAQTISCYENLEFTRALESLWSLQSAIDKYIVENKPWELAEKPDAASRQRLERTLGTAAEAIRVVAVLLHPLLPGATGKIWRQLGYAEPLAAQRIDQLRWGQLAAGQKIGPTEAVFPRLDKAEAIQKMEELDKQVAQEQAALMGMGKISIDDFARVDMRVGLVKSAERVKGADKLLHMSVDIGEPEPRCIVAGIALSYTPEQMVGRKVVIVANLQPRKLRGIESNGMIVAASLPDGAPVLAGFLEDVPVGARLK